MKRKLVFSFDSQHCSGCMACVVACCDQNDLKAEDIALRQVAALEDGNYPAVITHISTSCMHCGDAPCLTVCPSGAIFRQPDSGIVDIDRDLCIGCHSCETACPFGAPKFPADGKMIKCDMCIVRIENGLEPACVHTCTTGALTFYEAETANDCEATAASLNILRHTEVFPSRRSG